MINVLYIHGMGGGGDSRIPWILNASLREKGIHVIVRTYDFDPEEAARQIDSWIEELHPQLIMGESLGAVHALRIKRLPHILISPALNAPVYFSLFSWTAVLPGITLLLDRIYRPKEGDRQSIHFTYSIMRKYGAHRKAAIGNSPLYGNNDVFHAFIGSHDHYRRSGIVSIRTWRKYFGDTYSTYEGTHYTEDEYLHSMVIPKILEFLGIPDQVRDCGMAGTV